MFSEAILDLATVRIFLMHLDNIIGVPVYENMGIDTKINQITPITRKLLYFWHMFITNKWCQTPS